MTATLPPGPRDGVFGVRTAGRIMRDILGFYAGVHRDHGDAVYMRLGPYHDFTFFHPDQVREVLVEKAKHFVKMPRLTRVLRQWNGDSLLLTEGDTWLRQRRLAQPAFHPSRFAAYGDVVVAAGRDRLAGLTGEVDFAALMTDLTMDIITRTLLGGGLSDADRADLARAVAILNEVAVREMGSLVVAPDWLPLPAKRAKRWAMRTLDATVRRLIAARRTSGTDAGDLLSMLLLAVDSEADGKGLTDEEARDQCVTFFLAGHDTSAAGMIWVGWALASHPEVAARAAAEVDDVLGGRDPTFAELPRLRYVERVVKEALRLWPPAIGVFARAAVRDVEIGGWAVPKGGIVRVFSWVTQRDARWFPDPERFDPDRFAPGRVEQIPHGAYFPFGLGPRSCVGNHFAMTELTLLTALLVRRFTLTPAEGQQPPVPVAGMSLRPAGGLRLGLTPRG